MGMDVKGFLPKFCLVCRMLTLQLPYRRNTVIFSYYLTRQNFSWNSFANWICLRTCMLRCANMVLTLQEDHLTFSVFSYALTLLFSYSDQLPVFSRWFFSSQCFWIPNTVVAIHTTQSVCHGVCYNPSLWLSGWGKLSECFISFHIYIFSCGNQNMEVLLASPVKMQTNITVL